MSVRAQPIGASAGPPPTENVPVSTNKASTVQNLTNVASKTPALKTPASTVSASTVSASTVSASTTQALAVQASASKMTAAGNSTQPPPLPPRCKSLQQIL